jgi:Fe-S cluster biogenesis protein NfuA
MAALRKSRADREAVEARIRAALDALRPLLRVNAPVVELVEYEETRGLAVLRVDGHCPGCDMSAASLMEGIEAHLRMRVPEVREVRAAGSHT